MKCGGVFTSDTVTTQSPILSLKDHSALIAVIIFPLLILTAFAIAMITPDTFKPLTPGMNWALGVIMFGMGLTLTPPDFGLTTKCPLSVLVDVVTQYLIIPLVGQVLYYVFGLPDAVAAGVILVDCAPNGTASNVISYLAKADVAPPAIITPISTLLAPLMIPLLITWLVGNRMSVDGAVMAKSVLLMVLAPVLGGFTVRFVVGKLAEEVLPLLPWVLVFGICYVLLVVMSGLISKILTSGVSIITVVICHDLLDYLFGYLVGRIGRDSDKVSRTTAIEVGIQNSTLATVLAKTHFISALEAMPPAAAFSAWRNLSDALLVMFFCRQKNGGQA